MTDKAKRSNKIGGNGHRGDLRQHSVQWTVRADNEPRALSGLPKDKNIGYMAEYLTAVGIDLKEVRVVGDE